MSDPHAMVLTVTRSQSFSQNNLLKILFDKKKKTHHHWRANSLTLNHGQIPNGLCYYLKYVMIIETSVLLSQF